MNYQTISSLLPAVFTPTAQVAIVDIDGDGINEVVVLDPDIGQLAVIHQFTFSEISPGDWSDTTTNWWCQWTSAPSGTIPGGWTVQTGDVMVAGAFEGNGVELFLYNTTSLAWGLVKWDSDTGGLTTSFTTATGCTNWTPAPGDTFHLFPGPNGASTPGLLAFNTASLTLGVLQYAPGAFSCFSPTPGGNIDGWQFHANDRFHPGFIQSASTGSFLIFNHDTYIACLTWDGTTLHVSSGQTGALPSAPGSSGSWYIRGTDKMQCVDLNGDGLDEVFVYSRHDYIGALAWVGAQFETLAVAHHKDIANWTIGHADQYVPVSTAKGNGMLAYSGDLAEVAILQYGNAAFTSGGATSVLDQQWPVSQNLDVYFGADVRSSATPVGFVISPQNGAATLGALAADGLPSVTSSVVLPAPGWTPTLLAQAPVTTFPVPAFPTPSQMSVYQYVSNLFSTQTNGDIRSMYANSSFAEQFGPFGENLDGMTNPPAQKFSPGDWAAVQAAISAECLSVGAVYTTYATIRIVAQNAYGQQVSDIGAVKNAIQASLPSGYSTQPSGVEYWSGQFLVAALWACGLGTSAPLANFGSIAASLAGPQLTAQPGDTPSQTGYDDIDPVIIAPFTNSAITACLPPDVFGDPVKLRIFGELAPTTWALPADGSWIGAYSNADRGLMYPVLLPCVYSIAVIPNVIDATQPFFLSGFPPNPATNYFQGSNPDSYEIVGSLAGTIYALYVYTGSWTGFNATEAGTSVTADLITAGVGKQAYLSGTGAWSGIPRVLFTNGYFPGSPNGVITDQTSYVSNVNGAPPEAPSLIVAASIPS